MKIVVLDGYTLNPGDNPWDEIESLGDVTVHDRTPPEQVVERAAGADILLTNKTPVPAEAIARLPDLKFVAVLATGYNIVDVQAARERGIPVSNVPIYGTDSVAQFVMAMLLNHCHRIAHHDQRVKDGAWSSNDDWCFWDYPLLELAGLTMGIVGFGRIGRRAGELAHAFGMNVIAYDVYRGDAPGYEPFAWKSIDEVFAEADVVTLHCPQTADNKEFVNRALLHTMKPGALFINAARGTLVNEQDLADALNDGALAAAAVDVVSAEPIDPANPLLSAKNIVLTPHMAWGALAARRRIMQTSADNIRAFLDGSPAHVVNP